MWMLGLRDANSRYGIRSQPVAFKDQHLIKGIRQRTRSRDAGNPGADYYCSVADQLGQNRSPH
jgi:hypothetical protein